MRRFMNRYGLFPTYFIPDRTGSWALRRKNQSCNAGKLGDQKYRGVLCSDVRVFSPETAGEKLCNGR